MIMKKYLALLALPIILGACSATSSVAEPSTVASQTVVEPSPSPSSPKPVVKATPSPTHAKSTPTPTKTKAVVKVTPAGLAVGAAPGGYSVEAQPSSCTYRYTGAGQPLPDAHCTPGALNPDVTQATIDSTICVSGYTTKIRPSSDITDQEKAANAQSYGYSGSLSQAEYDHLVPLELGGAPNDARNLWVEPPSPGHRASQKFRNPKDTVENDAKRLVCGGEVPLARMQIVIASNWTTALAIVGYPA